MLVFAMCLDKYNELYVKCEGEIAKKSKYELHIFLWFRILNNSRN